MPHWNVRAAETLRRPRDAPVTQTSRTWRCPDRRARPRRSVTNSPCLGQPQRRPPPPSASTADAKNRAAGAPRGRRTRACAGVGRKVREARSSPSG